jgi:hypothetical protein
VRINFQCKTVMKMAHIVSTRCYATWPSFFVCTQHSKHHYSVNASRSKMPQVIQTYGHAVSTSQVINHNSPLAQIGTYIPPADKHSEPCSEFALQLVADPNPAAAFLCRCTWSVAECISVCYIVILTQPRSRLCDVATYCATISLLLLEYVIESINISLVNFDSESRRHHRRRHIRLCGLHNLCLVLNFSLFWQNSRKTCRSSPTSGAPTRPGDVSHFFFFIIVC